MRWTGSDRSTEFVEYCRDSEMTVAGVGAEFVVTAANVLHERMTADHHRRSPVGTVALFDRVAPIGVRGARFGQIVWASS